MFEEEQGQWTREVEYYLLQDQQVGRVTYDAQSGECCNGEIMDSGGCWQPSSAADIVCEGSRISRKEAKKRVKRLHGRLHD